ncbi:MAG: hypothetical protein ACLPVO_15415 [Desulfomonilaceae bacterium]
MPRKKQLIKSQELCSDLENIRDDAGPGGSRALKKALDLIEAKLTSLLAGGPESADSGDIYKLSNSLSGLVRAGTEMSKWAHERDEMFGRHLDYIRGHLRMKFRENQQVYRTIEAVLSRLDVGHD